MLDEDLAKIYQEETKILNQAVKRNIDRFPPEFMFQLTNQEYENLKSQIAASRRIPNELENLKSQIVTSSLTLAKGEANWGGRRHQRFHSLTIILSSFIL
ncbi:MAG: ORF6N domain-containing protein [Treponema sp.]|nr:ORF6N domain-containing protein [Treponema sp.]